LDITIYGFVLEEDTKPVYERHLQVFHRSQACLPMFYRNFYKATPPLAALYYDP